MHEPESRERFVHHPDSGCVRRYAAPAERQDATRVTSRPRAEARTSCPPMLLFKTATDRPDNRDVSLQPACYVNMKTLTTDGDLADVD